MSDSDSTDEDSDSVYDSISDSELERDNTGRAGEENVMGQWNELRRDMELLATAPEGIADVWGRITLALLRGGISSHPVPEDGLAMVRELIQLYRGSRELFKEMDVGRSTFLACAIVKACYTWRIEDSQLVYQCLLLMYDLMSDFRYIFIYFNTEYKRPFVKSDMRPMEYFFEHTTKTKVKFGGHRFVDCEVYRPVGESALDSALLSGHNANLILLLFRYGAQCRPLHQEPDNQNRILMQYLSQILYLIWNRSMRVTYSLANDRFVSSVKVILRAITQVQPGDLRRKARSRLLRRNLGSVDNARFLQEMANRYPCFRNRCLEVSDLKHLTRCRIREVLNAKWMLPHGINMLDLSECLRSYVDLMKD